MRATLTWRQILIYATLLAVSSNFRFLFSDNVALATIPLVENESYGIETPVLKSNVVGEKNATKDFSVGADQPFINSSEVFASNFDLTIWWREPSNVVSNLITTRDIQFPGIGDNRKDVRSMEEILNVDFQVCTNETCATFENNKKKIGRMQLMKISQYQQYKTRKIKIYMPTEKKTRIRPKLQIEGITIWSPEHNQHIALDRKWIVISCLLDDSGPEACPKSCPQNRERRDQEHPFMYDTHDGMCRSSHPDALPPNKSHGGPCWYESTCFTPEATILNSSWPWKDERERLQYYPEYSKEESRSIDKMRRECKKRSKDLQHYKYEARFECNMQENSSGELQCPAYGMFEHHVFFIPKAKLIFFGIPKAGITEWVKFFRHSLGAKDYLSIPHFKQDKNQFLLGNLHMDKATELLNDPNWTKAVFLRNPYERLLSAYFNKIIGENYAYRVFKRGTKGRIATNMTFEDFVHEISIEKEIEGKCIGPTGLNVCTDPHWKPQLLIGGLNYLLPKFDFIGNLDHIEEHTKLLLERIGLWENYGKTFDDGKDTILHQLWNSKYAMPVPNRLPNETIPGFNQRGQSKHNRAQTHSTGAKERLKEYYTPELLEKVRKLYHLDFAVWDEVSSSNKVANGKSLKVVQTFCANKDGQIDGR